MLAIRIFNILSTKGCQPLPRWHPFTGILCLISVENRQARCSEVPWCLLVAFGTADHIIIAGHIRDTAWFSKPFAPLIRCASMRLITVVYLWQHVLHPLRFGWRLPEGVVSLLWLWLRRHTSWEEEGLYDSNRATAIQKLPVAPVWLKLWGSQSRREGECELKPERASGIIRARLSLFFHWNDQELFIESFL